MASAVRQHSVRWVKNSTALAVIRVAICRERGLSFYKLEHLLHSTSRIALSATTTALCEGGVVVAADLL